jgi:hypothetical protein
VLGIREEIVLGELFDVLSTRLFGPGRLDLLRDELARTSAGGWHEHEAEITRRRRELADLDRSLYRQALRLEEHEDPTHPVVALAKQRIVELTAERERAEQDSRASRHGRRATSSPTRSRLRWPPSPT